MLRGKKGTRFGGSFILRPPSAETFTALGMRAGGEPALRLVLEFVVPWLGRAHHEPAAQRYEQARFTLRHFFKNVF